MRSRRNIYAVILAGGSGERLWPMSTPDRPKQFVSVFGGKPLIRHSVDRLRGFIPPERVLVITADALVRRTRAVLPAVPAGNIIGEPCRRDTAAAMAVACGLVKRLGGEDAVACVLTADQLISPEADLRAVLKDAVKAADELDAIVTLGIVPTRPATEFGYIECGKPLALKTSTRFRQVRRFVEKPDAATARRYVRSRSFRWNSGMFIWKVSAFEAEFMSSAPDIGGLIGQIASAKDIKAVMRRRYPAIRRISVDFAVMENAGRIVVAECDFRWDDVGSWVSLGNQFPADGDGNVALGRVKLLDTRSSIVVSDERHQVAVFGLEDVVVVHTADATLVCAKSKAVEMKRLLS